jgi:hypothetical protein
MKCASRKALRRIVLGAVVAFIGELLVSPAEAQLTSPGNNAVYTSGSTVVLSPAFIDASVFFPPNKGTHAADICDAVYQLLKGNPNFLTHGYPSSGTIIDARGLSGAALTCTKGSPWSESGVSVAAPSTILLPAGTIVIPTTWVLPSNTRLIGEGDSISSGTTIQAKASFSSADMIDLGTSFICDPIVAAR